MFHKSMILVSIVKMLNGKAEEFQKGGKQWEYGSPFFSFPPYFLSLFKLEANCFIILCWFLCKMMQISSKCMHIPFLLNLPLTPPHPTSLDHHRAPSWDPYAMKQLPTSYFIHGSVYMSVLYGFKGNRSKASQQDFRTSLKICLTPLGQEGLELGPRTRSQDPKQNVCLCHTITHLGHLPSRELEISTSPILSFRLLGDSQKIMWLLWSQDHEIAIEIILCLSGWFWIIMNTISEKQSANAEHVLSAESEWIPDLFISAYPSRRGLITVQGQN